MILVTPLCRRRADLDAYHASGFERVLVKPVRQSHLRDCLAEALGMREGQETSAPDQAIPAVSTKMRVLVAEDNRVNQKVVISQLAKLGHNGVAVANGLEALAAIEAIDYDVVLMDCQMPEMDGYEATRIIRRRPAYKDMPIIAMTANAMAGDRERCLEAGMDDYITKPLKLEELARVLSRQIRAPEPPAERQPAPLDNSVLEELRAIDPSNPEFLPALIALYLDDAPKRVQALRLAISDRDNERTWRSAHAFRSACANIGAQSLVEICSAIEKEARDGSTAGAAPALLGRLETAYLGVAEILTRMTSPSALDSVEPS
jgi:CheY-like chemotaxis protein/HPt (histidine-containing phosphotransfer) domain-containing protein